MNSELRQSKFKFCTIFLTKEDPLVSGVGKLGQIDFYCIEDPSRLGPITPKYAIASGLVDGLDIKINQWDMLSSLLKVWLKMQLVDAKRDIYWIDLAIKSTNVIHSPNVITFQFQSTSLIDNNLRTAKSIHNDIPIKKSRRDAGYGTFKNIRKIK